MQRTLRAKMLNKLIYMLNNINMGELKQEYKIQQNINSKYTQIFTIILDKVVDIYYKNLIRGKKEDIKKKEALKKQLEEDYDTYLKFAECVIDDKFLKRH